MCLLAFSHRVLDGAAVAVAADRDERYDRAWTSPQLQQQRPRMLCGLDAVAGGTWLGVNELGLLVAVTNRPKTNTPAAPRSRGLLCRDLLACRSAAAAAERAAAELRTGRYAGANYVCLDASQAIVVHAGDDLGAIELQPGLHVLTNGDVDDAGDRRVRLARERLEPAAGGSAAAFVAAARQVCAHDGIIVRGEDRGTVSADVIALTAPASTAIWLHAAGPPDRAAFEQRSEALRALLAGRRTAPAGIE